MKRIFVIILLLSATLVPAADTPARDRPLPGVLRSQGRTFLVENHNAAYIVWHALGITNATLVHLDAHDDCRYIAPEKLRGLPDLLARKDYQALLDQTDLSSSFNFTVRPDRMPFDIGNFIYPCLMDGTVTNFWWIVPDATLDDAARALLKESMRTVLNLPAPLRTIDDSTNRFSFALGQSIITVATLEALPVLPPGALLDIDVDFFALSGALSEDHIAGELPRDPAVVCATVSRRVPARAAATVAASVWGGYTPLMYRFLADACFDCFATGKYPPYAVLLGACVASLPRGPEAAALPPPPGDRTYEAAYEHLNALVDLMRGDDKTADGHLAKAIGASPQYRKALLDAAEALMLKGRFKAAHDKIDQYDRLTAQVTLPSLSTRLLVLIEEGQFKKAEDIAVRLMAWDRGPFLLPYGGVLTQQGRFDEALAIYEEAVRITPQSAAAHYNLGFLNEKKGNTGRAIELYTRAVALRPQSPRALEHLGYLLSNSGKTEEAARILQKAVELDPMNVTALNNLALCLCRQGRVDEGLRCYERALALNPDMANIRLNFGRALAAAGRTAEAAASYRAALKLRPGWEEAAKALDQLPKPPAKAQP